MIPLPLSIAKHLIKCKALVLPNLGRPMVVVKLGCLEVISKKKGQALYTPDSIEGQCEGDLNESWVRVGSGKMMQNLKVQEDLEDIAGWVPHHRNKLSLAIKQVMMFLTVEGLALDL